MDRQSNNAISKRNSAEKAGSLGILKTEDDLKLHQNSEPEWSEAGDNYSRHSLNALAKFELSKAWGRGHSELIHFATAPDQSGFPRGGAEQFIEETERSLHDAIMIVRRAIKNDSIVAGN